MVPIYQDREIEIVEALYERIVVYDQAISTTCEFCAELDCLLSFAIAARTYSFTRPQMSEENLIQIVQGRLIESLTDHIKTLKIH